MTKAQQIAINNHCRLACETAMPHFGTLIGWMNGRPISIVLTVNSGWE